MVACLVQGATGKPRVPSLGVLDVLTAEYYDGISQLDSFICDSGCGPKIQSLILTKDQLLELMGIVEKFPRDTKQFKECLDKFARSLPKKLQVS